MANFDMDKDLEMTASKPTIKAEVKSTPSGGQEVVFREGEHYVNLLMMTTQEELKHVLLVEQSAGRSVNVQKVIEFIDSTIEFLCHGGPTVKSMRSGNPKAVQLLYHFHEMCRGCTKIKKTWAPENKPPGWPVDVPFEDPNNGSQKKADKLKKDGLSAMYRFLRQEFMNKEESIRAAREDYMRSHPSNSLQTDKSPINQQIQLLYYQACGQLKEMLGNSPIAERLNEKIEQFYERISEGERMRLLFGELCMAITLRISQARLKDQLNLDDLTDELQQIHDQYQMVDSSIQPVSKDTPQLHPNTGGSQSQLRGSSVLPTPSQNWDHISDQASLPQQQQLPLNHTVPQLNHDVITHHQAQVFATPSPKQDILMMEQQPNLKLEETNQIADLSGFEDYSTVVLMASSNPIPVQGKRRFSETEESVSGSSGKVLAYLESKAPHTQMKMNKGSADDDIKWLIAELERNSTMLDPVNQQTSQDINGMFAQETTQNNISKVTPLTESMDVDL